jgi:hypothetical protein
MMTENVTYFSSCDFNFYEFQQKAVLSPSPPLLLQQLASTNTETYMCIPTALDELPRSHESLGSILGDILHRRYLLFH